MSGPPSDYNGPAAWAFTYGYLVHCAGDVFAHDWVNSYAGRAFPSMLEVTSDPTLLGVIARHLAIETTLDKRLSVSDPPSRFPTNSYWTRWCSTRGGAQRAGMNPVFQHYVSLYWEKEKRKNDTVPGLDLVVRPAAAEKLLVVHFTLRNPNSAETWLSWSSVSFRAVDAKGMNREDLQEFFNEQTGESVDAPLQPDQKIDAYTVITMPARGPATLLRSQAEDGNPLEFALGSAVAALQPPFADPTDPTGASALAEVPAAMGESIAVGNFSMTVDKIAYTRGPIQESGPSKGSQFLVANLRVRNQAPADQTLAWDSFEFSLRAPDGDDIPWNGELLAAKRDAAVEVTATPGREIALRIYFEVPLKLRPAALFAREGAGGRAYLVDVSGVK